MKKLILLTGQNCPLCEKAKEVLKSLNLREYTILEKDIYSNREWHDKYWDKINNDKDIYKYNNNIPNVIYTITQNLIDKVNTTKDNISDDNTNEYNYEKKLRPCATYNLY